MITKEKERERGRSCGGNFFVWRKNRRREKPRDLIRQKAQLLYPYVVQLVLRDIIVYRSLTLWESWPFILY